MKQTVCSEWQPWVTLFGECSQHQSMWINTTCQGYIKLGFQVAASGEEGDRLLVETSDDPASGWRTCFQVSLAQGQTSMSEVLSKSDPVGYSNNLLSWVRWRLTRVNDGTQAAVCFRAVVVTESEEVSA